VNYSSPRLGRPGRSESKPIGGRDGSHRAGYESENGQVNKARAATHAIGRSLDLDSLLEWIKLPNLIDVAVVATLLWVVISWLQTSPARLALISVAALAGLYALSQEFALELTTLLLQGFFAFFALVLVVVFQEDLRRLFEGIALWGLRRGKPRPAPDSVRLLVRTCYRLAQERIGALIVLPGREPLERHLEGGIQLDGRLSEELLESIFDPNSAGHDGALVLREDKVERFGAHLPLSTNWDQLGQRGTRHAAALGLAERSDALCIAVSEERGVVSLARRSELLEMPGPEAFSRGLEAFAKSSDKHKNGRPWLSRLLLRMGARWREAALALLLTLALWYVAVPGAALQRVTYPVDVSIENLPDGYILESTTPAAVQVTVEGRRRDLHLGNRGKVSVRIDAFLAQLGRRTFEIGPDEFIHPPELDLIRIEPSKVRISIERPENP
jgi:diadenylate cyclase